MSQESPRVLLQQPSFPGLGLNGKDTDGKNQGLPDFFLKPTQ
jgi:hypothetical protein